MAANEMKPILSVEKSIILLDTLMQAHRPLTLAELSQQTGCPKSTVYGLLSTMREHDLIEQDADGRYRLGLHLFEYGCAVSSSWNIAQLARPYLVELSHAAGDSAFLAVYHRGSAITLDQAEGHDGLRVVSSAGSRMPIYCTSQGKLFLSHLSESEALRLLRSTELTPYTPHTMVDIPTLQAELARIRAQGYAIEDGEYKIGLRSVSAPVYDVTGALRYAVGVVGMYRRVNSEEFRNAIALTCQTAAEISAALGYRR
ncbi:MAG: IclR family transcriptional regulator [Clostridiales bacterium]|nr:IclR family transcriptional regulator [Candidatus Cacconaster stercorequi]